MSASSSGGVPQTDGDTLLLDTTETGPHGSRRIEAIDGLRGIAVLAVMLFHTGWSPLAGGYLGVDVFFVISGFLIGGILFDSWQRSKSLHLSRFWLRRARRLAPALLLLLAMVALARLAVPQQSPDTWRAQILAALTYTTNWFEILSGSAYFRDFGPGSPLLHTWSLAIEEQFYVVFALLLLLVLPRIRRQRALLGILIAGAAISAASMVWASGWSEGWAYFSTVTRVQALLVGAVLALLVRRAGAWWRPRATGSREAIGWVAACAIGLALAVPFGVKFMYAGGFSIVAILVAVVIWASLAAGPLAKLLAWRPLVLLGVISYGVYLWHWPIFQLLQTDDRQSGLVAQAWAIALTLLLATVSYLLVERPIRFGRFTKWPESRQWMSYAVASLAIAVAVLPAARTVPESSELTWPAASQWPERIVVGGDSTMLTMFSHFPHDRYPLKTLKASTVMGCGVVPYAYVLNSREVDVGRCKQWLADWREFFSAQSPEAAIIGSAVWDVPDRVIDGVVRAPGTPEFDEAYVDAFRAAIADIGSDGQIPVYVVGQPCLRSDRAEVLNDPRRTAYLDELVRKAVASSPNARHVDVRPWTCDADGAGVTVQDRRVLRADGVHWAKAGAEQLWSQILTQMAGDHGATPTMTP